MFLSPVSEFPLLRGDNTTRKDAWDGGGTLHASIVENTDENRYYLWYRGEDNHPGQGGTPQVGLRFINQGGYDSVNNRTRTPYPVSQAYASGSNPLFDYDDFSFPLDAAFQPGTDNAGINSQCVVAKPGGGYFMYIHVANHNTTSKNHMAILESTDGTTWTFVKEMLNLSATNQGTSMCGLYVGGKYWFLYGRGTNEKGLRDSTNGTDFDNEYGAAIPLLTSGEGHIDSNNFAGEGRMFDPGDDHDYIYYIANGSPNYEDWPEGQLLYRKAKDDLGDGNYWDAYHSIINLRPPNYGGVWQTTPFQVGGKWYALGNGWGEPGFEQINTTNMNGLRDTAYYGINSGIGWKHVIDYDVTSLLALKNWTYHPLTDGNTYRFKSGGKYLTLNEDGSSVGLSPDPTNTKTQWTVQRQNRMWLLKPVSDTTKAICPDANTANLRERDLPLKIDTFDASDATNNYKFQWQFNLHGDMEPKLASIINRYSSLSIEQDATQGPHLANKSDIWKIEEVV